MDDHIPVEKVKDRELPIPTAWRSKIADIVDLISSSLGEKINDVDCLEQISLDVMSSIGESLTEYGCKIDPVSSSTWVTSIYRWMDGYWQVLVDLFSKGEQVDLVLFLKVTEFDGGYRFRVGSIHVP